MPREKSSRSGLRSAHAQASGADRKPLNAESSPSRAVSDASMVSTLCVGTIRDAPRSAEAERLWLHAHLERGKPNDQYSFSAISLAAIGSNSHSPLPCPNPGPLGIIKYPDTPEIPSLVPFLHVPNLSQPQTLALSFS